MKLKNIFKRKKKTTTVTGDALQRTLHKNLAFTANEQYKLLRTNLSFTLPEDTKCPIIGVTSSMRGEGKSTTSVNIAYVLAESGKRVMLLDGDLRIPSVAKKLNIESSPGLTDFLIRYKEMDVESFKSDLLDTLYIMPSGALPPNPSELLGSAKMERRLKYLAEQFDYIILDLPPVNLVSDALAVSKYLNGLILVVREEYAQKKDLEACIQQLKIGGVKVLGFVLNDASTGGGRYYKKYSKYGKYYKYYTSKKAENESEKKDENKSEEK